MEDNCVQIVNAPNVEQDFFNIKGLDNGNDVLAINAFEMLKSVKKYI